MKNIIGEYFDNGKLNIELVIESYKNYVLTIIKNSTNSLSNEDIEEIQEDVFLNIWNNQNKLDMTKEFSPYIAAITHNLIKNKFRDIKQNDNIYEYENLVSLDNIEINACNKEQNNALIEELEKFKSEDIRIFTEYYFYNKSIGDISKLLNLSKSKVKIRLFRMRNKLKKVLKERGFFNE